MTEYPHRCFGDVLEKLGDVQTGLARLEEKLDSSMATKQDHERRLRIIERSQWVLGGVAAAVGAVFGGHIPRFW